MYNFRSLSEMSYDFLKSFFSDFTPQVRLFFAAKGNLKFSDLKMWGIRKILNFLKR